MSTEKQQLTFQQEIQAEPTAVYQALTNPAILTQWLCADARVTLQENGRLYLYWAQGYSVIGQFTELIEGEKVAYQWQGWQEPAPTQVTFTLDPQENSTKLTLEHNQIPADEQWVSIVSELKNGWHNSLDNLKALLETGLDQRIYGRPFLGVLIAGAISPEEAEALNSAGGVHLGGHVENTGAATIGIQRGDILTAIDGKDIVNFNSFGPIMQGKQIGDEVTLTYFRDGKEQQASYKLTGRPAPDVPTTPAEFSKQLRDIQAQVDAELDEVLTDITDELAKTHPADGQWNVLENLGHLILTERSVQTGIWFQLSNQPLPGFAQNNLEPIHALIATHPTLTEMVDLWKRTERETAVIVASLPSTYIQRQWDYLNLGSMLLFGLPEHTRSHIRQIQQALQQVQNS